VKANRDHVADTELDVWLADGAEGAASGEPVLIPMTVQRVFRFPAHCCSFVWRQLLSFSDCHLSQHPLPTMTADPLRSRWQYVYALFIVLHLSCSWCALSPWGSVFKCFLAPVLFAWTLHSTGWARSKLLLVALVGCFLGDLFLELPDEFFVPGMVAFGVAHGCLITLFGRDCGGFQSLAKMQWIPLLYAAFGAALVACAWDGLPVFLRVAVPFYALLLLGTASVTLAVSWTAGLGGCVFLLSDALILLQQAKRTDVGAPAGFSLRPGILIMPLYIAAIWLITVDAVRRELEQGAPGTVHAEKNKQKIATATGTPSVTTAAAADTKTPLLHAMDTSSSSPSSSSSSSAGKSSVNRA
jgi:hypothetical protein